MQRTLLGAGAVAAVATLLGGGGCTADGGDGGITVLRGVAPSDTACTFSATDSEFTVSHGALDASFGTGYLLGIQMTSRITALTGTEVQRSVFVSGAKVDITFPDSTLFSSAELADLKSSGLIHFKDLFSTVIKPNGGVTDVAFELIPAELVARVRAKTGFTSVVALGSFRVVGGLGATGDSVESDVFPFPVTIVSAGLANNKGPCAELATSFSPRIGNPCNAGQDNVIDCCAAADGSPVCPAVGTKSS